VASVLRAFLLAQGGSDAGVVLVNAEDLWQALEPQNVPGTWHERPNWRRKAAHALEEFAQVPGLEEALRALDRSRKNANPSGHGRVQG
jgi:4-alpha-glucanotransferase